MIRNKIKSSLVFFLLSPFTAGIIRNHSLVKVDMMILNFCIYNGQSGLNISESDRPAALKKMFWLNIYYYYFLRCDVRKHPISPFEKKEEKKKRNCSNKKKSMTRE